MSVLASIPDQNEFHYPGRGNPSPPPADVGVIDTLLDPRLRTPVRLERIVDSIIENASDRSSPGWSGTTVLGNMGTSSDYRVVVVNGNCVLGSGTGFGILLVRGKLKPDRHFPMEWPDPGYRSGFDRLVGHRQRHRSPAASLWHELGRTIEVLQTNWAQCWRRRVPLMWISAEVEAVFSWRTLGLQAWTS